MWDAFDFLRSRGVGVLIGGNARDRDERRQEKKQDGNNSGINDLFRDLLRDIECRLPSVRRVRVCVRLK